MANGQMATTAELQLKMKFITLTVHRAHASIDSEMPFCVSCYCFY